MPDSSFLPSFLPAFLPSFSNCGRCLPRMPWRRRHPVHGSPDCETSRRPSACKRFRPRESEGVLPPTGLDAPAGLDGVVYFAIPCRFTPPEHPSQPLPRDRSPMVLLYPFRQGQYNTYKYLFHTGFPQICPPPPRFQLFLNRRGRRGHRAEKTAAWLQFTYAFHFLTRRIHVASMRRISQNSLCSGSCARRPGKPASLARKSWYSISRIQLRAT